MGRIKGTIVKKSTRDLIIFYKDKFNDKFDYNKKAVMEILPDIDKKFANSIAGYVTRVMRRELTKK